MKFLVNYKGRRAFQWHIRGNQMMNSNPAKGKEYHDKALQMYTEAYEAGCREGTVVMAYATLLMRYAEYEKSRQLLLECEKLRLDDKSKRQLRQNYSVCMWRMGNLDRAIEILKDLERHGKSEFIYTVLGYYLIEKALQTGDFEEALRYNMEALEYDEDDPGTLDNLGQLYYHMGEKDKAYEYFAHAFREKPTQVPTLYFIAKINLERGNKEKARQFIDKCLEGNFSALCSISREQAQALSDEIGK